jgi:ribosomal protein S12 methylthiotransferase
MGCAKNEVDSASMARTLASAGYVICDNPAQADAIIINTCSFIQAATEESIDAFFEAASLPNVRERGAKLVVAGCMPARYGEELEEELPEAQAFVPCSKEDDIVAIIEGLIGPARPAQAVYESAVPVEVAAGATPVRSSYFSYVKISDGCDRYCSFCTIPSIRGRYHSFTYERIHDDVAREVAAGVKEIVLIAQDTGRWGQDFTEPCTLAWLVNELAEAFPHTWFRVMYLQPEGVTDDLLQVMNDRENVCSYLDIPLQHVSKPLLRAMNRAGSGEKFRTLVSHIKQLVPEITLRTTLIAGFPGETEEQFEELLDFVGEGLFDYVGVFPYSREEGTAAYDLPNQVDEDTKLERAQILRDEADAVSATLIAARVGETLPVLVEGIEEDGQLFGRAQCQAPEVDGVTYVDAGTVGEWVKVTVVDTLMYEMEGEEV